MGEGIARLGQIVLSGVAWVGGLGGLLWRTLLVGPRRPIGAYDIAYQLMQQFIRSLPMATLMSMFLGMIFAWQFGEALADFGAKMALGYVSALGLVREVVPTVLAITVGARMSAGMAAELGSMKVSEQIDAVAALGADPIKKLVWPRLCGSTFGLPLLVVWGNLVALVGGTIIADTVFGVPADYFIETYIEELTPTDYLSSISKGFVFGSLVGLIGCYQGFNTKFGTEAVGIATTETVVATSITIIIADFFMTIIFLPV